MQIRHLAVAGLAAAVLAPAVATAAGPTYYRLPNGRLAVEPSRIEFSDLRLYAITWQRWGDRRATGTARATSVDADGSVVRTTARLRMFKRRTRAGRRIYLCMTGTVARGDFRRVVWPPGCDR